MASDSDLDGEDYYIVEDANESASFEYVPCINYPNDNVYPENEKNGLVRLKEDTGPPNIYRFEGSCWNYMDLKEYNPGAVFDEFFEDRMWTILSENTNKYVHAKLRKQKTMGTKILLNCWVRVSNRILVQDWIIGKIQVQMRWRYL